MRLLIIHNAYQHRGGEDVCVENESAALRQGGMDVTVRRIPSDRRLASVTAALGAPLGQSEVGRLEKVLETLRPDILHAHNLYPLLSPRLFRAAHLRGIKNVLTLHNFRPLCMNGLFMTPAGEICERCAPGNPLHGVWRGCYRSSRSQSLGMAAHLTLASQQRWYEEVDLFISPSEFLKDKYVRYGFPEKKIVVQGHFLPHWPEGQASGSKAPLLYLGRLSEEKGLHWLVRLFTNSKATDVLNIAGDGPLRPWVAGLQHPNVRYLGPLEAEAKWKALQSSRAVVLASRCYENFPMAIAEANCYGVPALVPNFGAMAESVSPGVNGEHFEPDNDSSFWKALHRLDETFSTPSRDSLRSWARRRFSVETFLQTRLSIYSGLVAR